MTVLMQRNAVISVRIRVNFWGGYRGGRVGSVAMVAVVRYFSVLQLIVLFMPQI